jgi:hypothetical protein
MLSLAECEALDKAGAGRVVRSRKGEVKRFICYARSRVYCDAREGIGALHAQEGAGVNVCDRPYSAGASSNGLAAT